MKQSDSASFFGWPALLALLIVCLDQASKWLTVFLCPEPGTKECIIIPHVLRFVHWRNQGAAFSMFFGQKFYLGILSAVVGIILVLFFKKCFGTNTGTKIAGACLIGGVFGNLIDRFFYTAGVIDFIRIEHWPAFNIADSAICCSMVWLVWQTWREELHKKRNLPEEKH